MDRDTLRAIALSSVLAFCLVFSCSSCGKRVGIPDEQTVVRGPGYLYQDHGTQTRLVATDRDALDRALKQICRGRPCAVLPVGTVYEVERVTK
jgi:hypothetical protein